MTTSACDLAATLSTQAAVQTTLTLQEVSTQARTLTGKRPSAASLQREREYMDWQENRFEEMKTKKWLQHYPIGAIDYDSMAVFMSLRRENKEQARLQKVTERRRAQRPPSKQKLDEEYAVWVQELPTEDCSHSERASRQAFMLQRRKQQQEKYNANRRKSTTRGRPIDPNSSRQRHFAQEALFQQQYTKWLHSLPEDIRSAGDYKSSEEEFIRQRREKQLAQRCREA